MRDHRKLRAFQHADDLTVAVCELTERFPKTEIFGLTSQIRRAALSIGSNIVEGCARHGEKDFISFLDIADASSKEVEYQLDLARRLHIVDAETTSPTEAIAHRTAKDLNNLIRSLRQSQKKR